MYLPGASSPVNQYPSPGSQEYLVSDGLGFSADGSALYAVYQDVAATDSFFLRVYQDPTVTASAITLAGPAKVVRGHSVTISGKLALIVGQPPAGSQVTITRTLAGSSMVATWTRTVASNGAFSLTDTPPDLGTYTYKAAYTGTATLQAATSSRALTVTKIPSSLRLAASRGTVNYRAQVKVTAHLGRTYNGRTVRIYARVFGTKTPRLIKTGRTRSDGDLTITYRPTRSTMFSATFAGDSKYQPASASRRVYVRSRVTQQIKGYYATETLGSTQYREYHGSGTLTSTVAVTPHQKGGCVAFEVQEYYQGSWQANVMSACRVLGSSSKTSVKYRLKGAVGGQFRIRGDFNRKSSDITNKNADSAWAYFRVTS